jgi:hypothetical protein
MFASAVVVLVKTSIKYENQGTFDGIPFLISIKMLFFAVNKSVNRFFRSFYS